MPIEETTDLNKLLAHIAKENQTTQLTLLTKTAQQTDALKEQITLSEKTITILPISLAKGLEFDHIVLYNVSSELFHTKRDRNILYTALSRGMQTVTLLYSQQLTHFLH